MYHEPMTRRVIHSPHAPKAIGPYSQAIVAGGFVFTSGQVGFDPASGALVHETDVKAQAEQVLVNLRAVLDAAGVGFDAVVKTTIFLVDMADFADVNEVYGRVVGTDAPPARSTVAVAALPRGSRVEIEMIALAPT